jgi:ketosteroid isomerase-like protein
VVGAAENEARIRGAYEAFNTGDVATLLDVFDEDIVWHFPGSSKLAGEHIGRDDTMAFLGAYGAAGGGTLHATVIDVVAREDLVAGWAQDTASVDGKSLDVRAVVMFAMRDGKVIEAWHHYEDLYSLDAFLK